MTGYVKCPRCKKLTLPRITGTEDAVTCQNPDCRAVFGADEKVIGWWSAGYAEYVDLLCMEGDRNRKSLPPNGQA